MSRQSGFWYRLSAQKWSTPAQQQQYHLRLFALRMTFCEQCPYLVPLHITDCNLIDHAGFPAAVAELYGNKDARNEYFDTIVSCVSMAGFAI